VLSSSCHGALSRQSSSLPLSYSQPNGEPQVCFMPLLRCVVWCHCCVVLCGVVCFVLLLKSPSPSPLYLFFLFLLRLFFSLSLSRSLPPSHSPIPHFLSLFHPLHFLNPISILHSISPYHTHSNTLHLPILHSPHTLLFPLLSGYGICNAFGNLCGGVAVFIFLYAQQPIDKATTYSFPCRSVFDQNENRKFHL
jgi:hypothetical protein